jgi:hypothetical protein
MRILRSISLVALLVVASFLVSGCQTEAEATRAMVRARQDGWTRQVKALSAQEAGLRERLGRLPAPKLDAPAERLAPRLRAEGMLGASQQSLADLQISIRQAAGRIEAAAGQGTEGQAAVLDRESARVERILAMLSEQLASTEKDIARIHTN